MAVSRSTAAERARNPERSLSGTRAGRGLERLLLLLASILIGGALALTALARIARVSEATSAPLNLSNVDRREQLLTYLQSIASPTERQYIAGKIFLQARGNGAGMSHVGEIGQIRVPIREVLSTRGLTNLQARAKQIQSTHPGADSMSLLTA